MCPTPHAKATATESSAEAPHAPRATPRHAGIDVLKAVCLLGVVLQHSLRVGWAPGITPTEIWLWNMTRFAVPGFLLASGFLYATAHPVLASTTAARLRRILAPYLVASLVAELSKVAYGANITTASVLRDVLIGNALGIYYYVFVLFWLVLLTPLLARLPRSIIPVLVVAAVVAQFAQRLGWITLDATWSWRSPLVWWVYFFVGWWIRMHESQIRLWITRNRLWACLGTGTIVAGCGTIMATAAGPHVGLMTFTVYPALGFLMAASWGRARTSRSVRLLSEASYPVYLFHVFFILTAGAAIGPDRGLAIQIGALFTAGLAGPLALALAAQRILGRRSRDVIGF